MTLLLVLLNIGLVAAMGNCIPDLRLPSVATYCLHMVAEHAEAAPCKTKILQPALCRACHCCCSGWCIPPACLMCSNAFEPAAAICSAPLFNCPNAVHVVGLLNLNCCHCPSLLLFFSAPWRWRPRCLLLHTPSTDGTLQAAHHLRSALLAALHPASVTRCCCVARPTPAGHDSVLLEAPLSGCFMS